MLMGRLGSLAEVMHLVMLSFVRTGVRPHLYGEDPSCSIYCWTPYLALGLFAG